MWCGSINEIAGVEYIAHNIYYVKYWTSLKAVTKNNKIRSASPAKRNILVRMTEIIAVPLHVIDDQLPDSVARIFAINISQVRPLAFRDVGIRSS